MNSPFGVLLLQFVFENRYQCSNIGQEAIGPMRTKCCGCHICSIVVSLRVPGWKREEAGEGNDCTQMSQMRFKWLGIGSCYVYDAKEKALVRKAVYFV